MTPCKLQTQREALKERQPGQDEGAREQKQQKGCVGHGHVTLRSTGRAYLAGVQDWENSSSVEGGKITGADYL